MQRIMIVSDTHRRHGNLSEALYNEGDIDMLIHLGDVEGEEDIISGMAGCQCIFIEIMTSSQDWTERRRLR